AIVDHQLQAGILLAEAPTDPAIACRALQCRGRKAQQRDPLLPPARHVPKRFSNLGQMAQVVMLSHELLVARLFAGMNEPHPPSRAVPYAQQSHCSRDAFKSENTGAGQRCPEKSITV